jgi:hypothetical protein
MLFMIIKELYNRSVATDFGTVKQKEVLIE